MTDKQALSEVVRWALGYSDFPARREGEPAFYWRTHLRNKLNDFGYCIAEDGTVSQLPGAEPLPLNADVEQAAKEYSDEIWVYNKRAINNAFIAGAGYGKEDSTKLCAPDDYQMKRLYDWIMDENRRKAGSFFTAGWTRNVAKEIEFRIGKGGEDNVTITACIIKHLESEADTLDKPYLGHNGKMYTRREVAQAIKNKTDFGKEVFDNVVGLTVEMLSRKSSRPSIDVVKELSNCNPYKEYTDGTKTGNEGDWLKYNCSLTWIQCVAQLSELLTQNK